MALTLVDWLQSAQKKLENAGIASARAEALALASHALRRDRSFILAHPLDEVIVTEIDPLLERRLRREPLAYILGYREFYGRPFAVRPGVLIPRQETESLVDAALELIPSVSAIVLDLGTGSGCIALTLKLERPDWDVWASDVSELALEVAEENSRALESEVHLILSDSFAGMSGMEFDAIVSNPPYVETGAELQPEIRDWEPSEALFAGPMGTDFYGRIAEEVPEHLREGGLLLVEVGDGMADRIAELFEARGWKEVARRQDLLGHDRVIAFQVDDST